MEKFILLLIFTLSFSNLSSQNLNNNDNQIHKENIEAGKTKLKIFLNNRLDKIKEAIRKEEEKLSDIKDFQFGRLNSTKEKQIEKQKDKISTLEKYKLRIENELINSNIHKTFKFQKNPKQLVKYLFNAMQKKDFKKLRHLCDPYMENDSDVNGICLINTFNDKQKEQIVNRFKNGRIMGDSVIEKNKAEIEVAIGINAKKLEKITLVERNDYWYLFSF